MLALAVVAGALLVVPLVAIGVEGGFAALPRAVRDPFVLAALRLTVVTSAIATAIALVLGTALALVAERRGGWAATLAGLAGEVTLVVPPVVLGLGLLATFGRNGLLGGFVDAANFRITFTSTAVVLAQVLAAMPLAVVAIRSGLRTLDPTPERVAAVHGASPWQQLRLAVLPAMRGPVLLGGALAWGRAAGEFGATLTFAGSLPGRTQTLPLAVHAGLPIDPDLAAAAALVQVSLAILTLVIARRLGTAVGMGR